MKSEEAVEFEIKALAAKLRKGGLNALAMIPIRMQIRILYWVLEKDIKGEYHWTVDD